MPVRPIVVMFISFVAALYSVIHIFRLAVPSIQYVEGKLVSSMSEPMLILDPSFWFWTILSWLSAYFLIKNYIILQQRFVSKVLME
jgi:hypothetical protein